MKLNHVDRTDQRTIELAQEATLSADLHGVLGVIENLDRALDELNNEIEELKRDLADAEAEIGRLESQL